MKSIRLRKSIMVEGKIISKGARILVEPEDVEDVGTPLDTSANMEDDVDVAKADVDAANDRLDVITQKYTK